jgi:hypothetical protein
MEATCEPATVTVRLVPLASIRIDSGSQARVKIHEPTVREYAQAMRRQKEEGDLRFPAIVLFGETEVSTQGGQSKYWLGDGAHRYLAAKLAGFEEILAEVHVGGRRDALLYSLSANSTHGLPRTNADKRKAVSLLLADAEWSKWSDREIARRCQVGGGLVHRMRRSASAPKAQMRERKVRRSGVVYEMSTPARSVDAEPNLVAGSKPGLPKTPATQPVPCGGEREEKLGSPSMDTADRLAATDALGLPLSEPVVAAFAARANFEIAKSLHGQLAEATDRIARGPGGEVLATKLERVSRDGGATFTSRDLGAARQKLVESEPYASRCPYCYLAHPGWTHPDCKACAGRGWLTRVAYESCPENYRQQAIGSMT